MSFKENILLLLLLLGFMVLAGWRVFEIGYKVGYVDAIMRMMQQPQQKQPDTFRTRWQLHSKTISLNNVRQLQE